MGLLDYWGRRAVQTLLLSKATAIVSAGFCVVSLTGAAIGLTYADPEDTWLRLGYIGIIASALIGLAGATEVYHRRKRVLGEARIRAETALGTLEILHEPPVARAYTVVADLLEPDWEILRWLGVTKDPREFIESLSPALFASVRAPTNEARKQLAIAISLLVAGGATDTAAELVARERRLSDFEPEESHLR